MQIPSAPFTTLQLPELLSVFTVERESAGERHCGAHRSHKQPQCSIVKGPGPAARRLLPVLMAVLFLHTQGQHIDALCWELWQCGLLYVLLY